MDTTSRPPSDPPPSAGLARSLDEAGVEYELVDYPAPLRRVPAGERLPGRTVCSGCACFRERRARWRSHPRASGSRVEFTVEGHGR